MKELRRFLRNWLFAVGATSFAVVLLVVVVGPMVYTVDPYAQNPRLRLRPPSWWEGGLPGHPMGTDPLGRDMLARLMLGGRTSLAVSVASNVLALLVGVPVGLIAGYYGRWADTCLMRLADIQLSVPTTLLAIAVVAVLGPSMVNLVIVLAITRWVLYARAVRASVLEIKEREFVEAAVAAGAPHLVVIKRHVLRNVMTPIIIITSQGIGFIILLEAALSFLGLGVQPPHPSWGEMIAAGRQYLNVAPWVVLAPGLALMITVLAVNFLGDGIRDLLDPRLRW